MVTRSLRLRLVTRYALVLTAVLLLLGAVTFLLLQHYLVAGTLPRARSASAAWSRPASPRPAPRQRWSRC
jgi:hypothetical protein